MRALILGAVVVVAGCQCLVPVDEDAGVLTDAGRTGGGGATGGGATGGGTSSGGGGATGGGGTDAGQCVTWADCMGTPPAVVDQCFGTTTGVWSCAFGRCVVECSQPRTCRSVIAGSGCIDCDAGTRCLDTTSCPMVTSIYLESSTCGLPAGPLSAEPLSSLPCSYLARFPDGGVLGTISYFGFDELVANIPSLGGGCIGTQLPTGALRHNVSCPDCMLSVMP